MNALWVFATIIYISCFPKMHRTKHFVPGPLGQTDAPSNWYSGGCGFDPWSDHISFVEIRSWNNFFGHSLPITDSSSAVVSYWWKYGHFVLVNHFGKKIDKFRKSHKQKPQPTPNRKPAQEQCGQVNWPAWHDLNSVDWAVKLQTNKQSILWNVLWNATPLLTGENSCPGFPGCLLDS